MRKKKKKTGAGGDAALRPDRHPRGKHGVHPRQPRAGQRSGVGRGGRGGGRQTEVYGRAWATDSVPLLSRPTHPLTHSLTSSADYY